MKPSIFDIMFDSEQPSMRDVLHAAGRILLSVLVLIVVFLTFGAFATGALWLTEGWCSLLGIEADFLPETLP